MTNFWWTLHFNSWVRICFCQQAVKLVNQLEYFTLKRHIGNTNIFYYWYLKFAVRPGKVYDLKLGWKKSPKLFLISTVHSKNLPYLLGFLLARPLCKIRKILVSEKFIVIAESSICYNYSTNIICTYLRRQGCKRLCCTLLSAIRKDMEYANAWHA